MRHTPPIRTVAGCTALLLTLGAGAVACGGSESSRLSAAPYDAADQVSLSSAKSKGKSVRVPLDKPLEITVKDDGRITDVNAVDPAGHHLAGELDADGKRWRSTGPLAADTRYTVKVSTENGDGDPGRRTFTFRTAKLPADKKLMRVTFGPKAGEYGVGQPLTAELSTPIKSKAQRAVVERSLRVTSVPAVSGSWYWVDATHLHFRPEKYWPAHASITASSALQGVRIGGKLFGGTSKPLTITTGDAFLALTDASTHHMTVYKNGKVIKDFPVTTGKPGFDTRNGVKVVLEKTYYVQMRSATVGIAAGSSDSYDLPVYYATRVTWSGEYVHAAPWSVGSQGVANTSHGCVGMSTANAEWFFDHVRPGDVVQVVHSDGHTMEPFDNGYGDWNLSWAKWQQGSAVHGSGTNTASKAPDDAAAVAARLRPGV